MKIVVIGAGVIGTSTAYFLARDGHDVTVLDRAGEAAAETSHANGGLLTPSLSDPWNAPGVGLKMLQWIGREDSPLLLRFRALPSLGFWGLRFLANSTPERFRRNMAANATLSFYTLDVMDELLAEDQLEFDHGATGTLKICRDSRGLDDVIALAEATRELGVEYDVVDAAGVVAVEPALADIEANLMGGVLFPRDRFGDAAAFTRELARSAAARGVVFRHGVTVSRVIRQGSLATGVETSIGPMDADAVVVAAGSYSPALARTAGFSVPVRPAKGYSCTLSTTGWNDRPRMPVMDNDKHIVATPLGDRLRLAGTAEFAGFDIRPTQSRIDTLLDYYRATFPAAADRIKNIEVNAWAGLRPMSADGVAFIGQAEAGRGGAENVFLNTGHGHLGWTQAAGSGQLLADLVSGRSPRIDPSPYRATR